jgi:DNA-binding NarL/FixJ family response regulator
LSSSIVIADSSELVLKGLKTIIEEDNDVEVILTCNFIELKSAINSSENFLLIIDYTSKGFSLDHILELKNDFPRLKIVAITPYTNAQTIVQAAQAGIESHLQKECSIKEIKTAIKATISGQKFFCDGIIHQMRNESINIDKVSFNSLKPESIQLSERELQIIQFIAEGYTNSQIAAIVYLSNHTINTHRKNIMKKLGVNNTAGIVMYAVKSNIVSPNQFSFKKADK